MFSRLQCVRPTVAAVRSRGARTALSAAARAAARQAGGGQVQRLSTSSWVKMLPRQAVAASARRPSVLRAARNIATTAARAGRKGKGPRSQHGRHVAYHFGHHHHHHPGGWGLIKKIFAGIVVTGVAVFVLSTGAVIFVTGAVVVGVGLLFIRFAPVRHPTLRMVKEAMMTASAVRESARVAARGWKLVASRARADIRTVLKEHSYVQNNFGRVGKVSRMELVSMRPLEGAVGQGPMAYGPHQVTMRARVKPARSRSGEDYHVRNPAHVDLVADVTIPSPDEAAQMMEDRGYRVWERMFSDEGFKPSQGDEGWAYPRNQVVKMVSLTWLPYIGEPFELVRNGRSTDTAGSSSTSSSSSSSTGTVVDASFHDKS